MNKSSVVTAYTICTSVTCRHSVSLCCALPPSVLQPLCPGGGKGHCSSEVSNLKTKTLSATMIKFLPHDFLG